MSDKTNDYIEILVIIVHMIFIDSWEEGLTLEFNMPWFS